MYGAVDVYAVQDQRDGLGNKGKRNVETRSSIEVPRELTVDGQFYDLLETFCTSRIRAQSSEELFMGKPWTEDGKTMFMINGLMEFLQQRNLRLLHEHRYKND